MRRWLFGWLCCWSAMTLCAGAATGRVTKVLPLFLDLEGRSALSPSLYDRDAYQAVLAQHPERVSAKKFAVEWSTKGSATEPLKLQVELRGTTQAGAPEQLVLTASVQPTGWFGRWTDLELKPEQYKTLGEVVAWRVTLWEGGQLLGEQKSFLW